MSPGRWRGGGAAGGRSQGTDGSLPHRASPVPPLLESAEGPSTPEMLILSCYSKLQLLEGTLWRRLPDTLLVYGTVMTINWGNPAAQEVLVDSWPEFKVVLTRPQREVASDDSDLYTNTHTVYSRDLDGCWPVRLLSIGDRPSASLITCAPKHLGELDLAIRLSSLDVSHADLLNGMWSFGGNEKNRKYLATLIGHFPSVCLLNSDGHPVSWITSYPFGAMEPGYTLPQHWWHGYMGMLNNLLAKRLHALGYPSYSYMVVENYPMQRLQESCWPRPRAWHQTGLCPIL
uniref:Glycine N-acyltransferase-like protein n=1 Tax=Chelonoidis abingdonii TaxID=106734 RepID=A0A8C0GZH3_CHEAB